MRGAPKKLLKDGTLCPVCGKMRGKGVMFIDHGACAEKSAAEALKLHPSKNGHDPVSDESVRIGRAKDSTKKYLSGRLPKWMTDK